MTDTSMQEPGTNEPLILERLSDLQDQAEYLAHYPDIRSWLVINPLGDEVGEVEELYVNPRNRQIEMAAIAFTSIEGCGGKRILVPVEELLVGDGQVRILTHAERIQLAPEFQEAAPSYEPYYSYWSKSPAGLAEELAPGCVHPFGRLELEGYAELREEEEEEEPVEERTT